MLPYKPRPPCYGGKLRKKRKLQAAQLRAAQAPTETGRRRKKLESLAPLADGGPIERSIKKDLSALRVLFESLSGGSGKRSKEESVRRAKRPGERPAEHDTLGNSFSSFKSVYKGGKFGLIHTRCVPPRCDRSDFQQLLYGACLSLLEEALANERRNENSALDFSGAVFAVFALYTLYETNPLPSFPDPEYSNAHSSKKSVDSSSLPLEDKPSLTTLTMGVGISSSGHNLYRRSYRSPIRASFLHHVLFLQLRDSSLEIMGKCEVRRMEVWMHDIENIESSLKRSCMNDNEHVTVEPAKQNRCGGGDWTCDCGMAIDCIQVIDKILENLDFCEYSGPCSLEGLTGGAEYFRKVIAPDMKPRSHVTNTITNEELQDLKPGDSDPLLELDMLYKAKECYLKSVGCVQQQLMKAGVAKRHTQQASLKYMQPLNHVRSSSAMKQLEKVFDIANGVNENISGNSEGETSDMSFNGISDLRNRANLSASHRGHHTSRAKDNGGKEANERNIINAATMKDANHPTGSTLANVDEESAVQDKGGNKCNLPIIYPKTFSVSLKNGIDAVLAGVLKDAQNKPLTTEAIACDQLDGAGYLEDEAVAYGYPEDDVASVGLVMNDEDKSLYNIKDGLISVALAEDDSENEDDLIFPSGDATSNVTTLSSFAGQNTVHKLLTSVGKNYLPFKSKGSRLSNESRTTKMPLDDESTKTNDGAGRAALESLLAKVGTVKIKKSLLPRSLPVTLTEDDSENEDDLVFPTGNGRSKVTTLSSFAGQNTAHKLLTSVGKNHLTFEPKGSCLSNESGTTKMPFDDESMKANDGAGRAALESLLAGIDAVTKNKKKSPRVKKGNGPKKVNSDRDLHYEQRCDKDSKTVDLDTASTGTGAGRSALQTLISQAAVNQAEQAPFEGEIQSDNKSFATCDGVGQDALKSLIAQVGRSPVKKKTVRSYRERNKGPLVEETKVDVCHNMSQVRSVQNNNEDTSVDTSNVESEVGKLALQTLLSQAAVVDQHVPVHQHLTNGDDASNASSVMHNANADAAITRKRGLTPAASQTRKKQRRIRNKTILEENGAIDPKRNEPASLHVMPHLDGVTTVCSANHSNVMTSMTAAFCSDEEDYGSDDVDSDSANEDTTSVQTGIGRSALHTLLSCVDYVDKFGKDDL